LSLPVIIHQRESRDEIIEVVEKMKGNLPEKIVFHCFGSDEKLAQYCEENGFFISFTGIITFKNASGVKKIAKNFHLERIMAETDSPYLSPSPLRGKRNEPARVRYIVEEIANQKCMPIKEISDVIFVNSVKFFSIPLQN
ncbi:MAG: hydrolase TatD, partial [Candidatus Omnitrophota bacterium]